MQFCATINRFAVEFLAQKKLDLELLPISCQARDTKCDRHESYYNFIVSQSKAFDPFFLMHCFHPILYATLSQNQILFMIGNAHTSCSRKKKRFSPFRAFRF